jgi:predicted transcriptional regulator
MRQPELQPVAPAGPILPAHVRSCPILLYNTSMRTAKTVSITLPPELLAKAQDRARSEHRTMSELFREALRHYIAGAEPSDPGWEALLRRTRETGRALGISNEEDVERLSDDFRREA